jgi:acyl-CoA thioester hydrolase
VYETTVPLRYDDLDTAGHVNNARYATLIEEARIDFFAEALGVDLREVGIVVARLEIDFERPLRFGADPTVRVGVGSVGETSLTLDYEVRKGGEPAASGETVLVSYDFAAGEPKPVPREWREELAAYED